MVIAVSEESGQCDGHPTLTVNYKNMDKKYEPPPSAKKDKVKIVANNELTFLDKKMSCSPEEALLFRLFRKRGE